MHFVLKKPLASYRQFNSLEVRISAQILSFILSNKTGLSSQSPEEMLAVNADGVNRCRSVIKPECTRCGYLSGNSDAPLYKCHTGSCPDKHRVVPIKIKKSK